MAKKSISYEDAVLAVLDEQIEALSDPKQLDYKPINLQRGSYVAGTISFGSLALDLITGGGLPPGKMTDVFGPEASGKSTLCGQVMANAQKMKIPIIFYDHEGGTDPIYFRNLGMRFQTEDGSPNRGFRYFQADNGTTTYRHINRILRALPDWVASTDGSRPHPGLLIVIDSLDAMIAGEYVDNDEENRRGVQASMHGDGMRLIKGLMARKNVSILCTNQLKLSPGVSFGNPEYEPGGQAVKYYPDLKIRVQAVAKPFNERGRTMRYVNVQTIKNKQFVPFRVLQEKVKTAPAIAFGRGFERGQDGLVYLRLTEQIKSGAGWYTLDTPGAEWNKKKMRKGDLATLCCSEEFRVWARGQIETGYAFQRYFSQQQIEWTGVDLTDSGATEEDNEVAVEDETPIPLDSVMGGEDLKEFNSPAVRV